MEETESLQYTKKRISHLSQGARLAVWDPESALVVAQGQVFLPEH